MEISVGIAGYVAKDSLDGELASIWAASKTSADAGHNATIGGIQNAFHCCGYASLTDFIVIPCSYTTTCRDFLLSSAQGSLNTIGGAGIAIGVIEIVGLVFSVILFKKIASRDNAQSSLLNEAWRINRTKIQYGYQNYQYA